MGPALERYGAPKAEMRTRGRTRINIRKPRVFGPVICPFCDRLRFSAHTIHYYTLVKGASRPPAGVLARRHSHQYLLCLAYFCERQSTVKKFHRYAAVSNKRDAARPRAFLQTKYSHKHRNCQKRRRRDDAAPQNTASHPPHSYTSPRDWRAHQNHSRARRALLRSAGRRTT